MYKRLEHKTKAWVWEEDLERQIGSEQVREREREVTQAFNCLRNLIKMAIEILFFDQERTDQADTGQLINER